jgi:hypothetical protein
MKRTIPMKPIEIKINKRIKINKSLFNNGGGLK